jgi:cathepsin X
MRSFFALSSALAVAFIAGALSEGADVRMLGDEIDLGESMGSQVLGMAKDFDPISVRVIEHAAAKEASDLGEAEKDDVHQPPQLDEDGIPNHYIALDDGDERKNQVMSAVPHDTLDMIQMPESFDWRNVNGKSFASVARNQHIPQYCGACWAFASLSAVNDRIKIMRKDKWPEIVLSPQHMLSCGNAGSCFGGNHFLAYKWLTDEGNVDETCAPYQAQDFTTERHNSWGQTVHDHNCTPERVCKDCKHSGGCSAVENPKKYQISEYGQVKGEDNIKKEIKARGPVACGVAVTDSFMKHYKGGVFEDMTGERKIRHVVSLLGWGVADDGTKYWVGRNSWGTYWGENGFFKIVRGKNNLRIEDECAWAVPKKNWEDASSMLGQEDVLVEGREGNTEHFLTHHKAQAKTSIELGEHEPQFSGFLSPTDQEA